MLPVCLFGRRFVSLPCSTSLDSTQKSNTLSALPSQVNPTTLAPSMSAGQVHYRTGNGFNAMPVLSTCSPNARDTCNGGQCILISEGVYGCRCRAGYTGVYCETSWVEIVEIISSIYRFLWLDINECASNPWYNSASLLFFVLQWSLKILAKAVAHVTIWSMPMLVSVLIESSVLNAITRVEHPRRPRTIKSCSAVATTVRLRNPKRRSLSLSMSRNIFR